MGNLAEKLDSVINNGFAIINNIYSTVEIKSLIAAIDAVDQTNISFRKTDDLFAIRQLLKEVPKIKPIVFNDKLKSLIDELFGNSYFIVKSIYFDKPEKSNWFVAWHQDLTIAVDKRADLPEYGSWTVKFNQFAVQPPVDILQNSFTIRIHLDDTNRDNGALKVISGSHLNGIHRVDSIDWSTISETVCNVNAGGVMIMRPLLMHASNRTTTSNKRRVIHIEFSKVPLPSEINWAEKELY